MNHYNNEYFSWQKKIGEFGGQVNINKFSDLLEARPSHVLDVGCGGGFLAKNIQQRYSLHVDGFDVNPVALESCKENSVNAFSSFDSIPDGYYDLIISNHCLEHIHSPYEFICKIKTKMCPGGFLRFYVPLDSLAVKYNPSNIDKHLYSWSPMNLGNLFSAAGFDVIQSKPYMHRWPPFYMPIHKILGNHGFNLTSALYARILNKYNQVFVTCMKPHP